MKNPTLIKDYVNLSGVYGIWNGGNATWDFIEYLLVSKASSMISDNMLVITLMLITTVCTQRADQTSHITTVFCRLIIHDMF